MDHSARVQFDEEESEERTEEKVCHGKKVAGPDLLGMGVYERPPRLSSWPAGAHSSHVLLNGALADADAQLEQFAPDALCSPQSIVPRHLLNQGDSLLGDPWLERSSLRLVSPKELETLTTPAQQRLGLDNEQRLLPSANDPGQKHQEHAVRLGTGSPFHLSTQDDQLLTEECVFCHEFGFASGKVGQRPQQERSGVRFGPNDETVVERLKTKTCQPRDERENPLHSICYPFIKMSE